MTAFTVATAAIPLYNAYKAYRLWNFKLPEHHLDGEITNEGIRKFATNFGVRGDIRVFSSSNLMEKYGTMAVAVGNQSLSRGSLAVYLDDAVQQDYLSGNVLIRHEYTHIKKNDTLYSRLLTTSVGILSASITLVTAPPLAALVITAAATSAISSWHSHFIENRADDEAFAHSNVDELRQAISVMQHDQENAISTRNQNGLLGRLLITSSGERRGLLLSYPSLASRIEKASRILATKGKER